MEQHYLTQTTQGTAKSKHVPLSAPEVAIGLVLIANVSARVVVALRASS
jgi:hypothetical protein